MICWHKLYHFTVANTRFTAPLTRRGKTKFATVKWYNLCQQIIQSQTCYPLIEAMYIKRKHTTVYVQNETPVIKSNLGLDSVNYKINYIVYPTHW